MVSLFIISASISFVLPKNPLQPIPATLIISPNDTVTISILGSTGTVYWSSGAFGTSIAVNPSVTTTYYAIDDFGGANDTLFAAITIKTIQSFIDIHPGGVYCPGDTFFSILLINPIGNVIWSTGDTTNTIYVISFAGF